MRKRNIHVHPCKETSHLAGGVLGMAPEMTGFNAQQTNDVRDLSPTVAPVLSNQDIRGDKNFQVGISGSENTIHITYNSPLEGGTGTSEESAKSQVRQRVTPSYDKLVHISHLPETGYETLIGRDAELARLHSAWEDREVNIISLIAEGGAGKSALLNEWLRRLQRENYRGAEVVLGWSFYSQGSKKRATSAEPFLDWALKQLRQVARSNSPTAKGEAIAEAMMKQRVLLALDGVEPLQDGPGPQAGHLRDQGLRTLLLRFAAESSTGNLGLIVLTSRVEIADIAKWRKGSAPVERIEKLSDSAGAELLAENGVKGTSKDLKEASKDFGGHPLALQLLASFLTETQHGDVHRRDHIRGLLSDSDNHGHDHARRVMESYEKEWLADQPLLLAILSIVGLFDRPASADCLKALRARPAIRGLTDGKIGLGRLLGVSLGVREYAPPRTLEKLRALSSSANARAILDLSDEDWNRSVQRLRSVRLLSPPDPADPDALDAHPLVREWFGEHLLRKNRAAWIAAHGRLYEHLRDRTKEGNEPSLAALTPLYHAIAHGCRGAQHKKALDEIYKKRICRRGPRGELLYYSINVLGAHSSDLEAVSWFFDKPYEAPVAELNATDRALVLAVAASALRSQGRLNEALPAMRAGLLLYERDADWKNAARAAANLSEDELTVGEVANAFATAKRSVSHADRSADEFLMMDFRTVHAATLAAAGQSDKAESLFVDAEARQRKLPPKHPFLHSLRGYQYCDLLLARNEFAAVCARATQTLAIATQNRWILCIALDTLTLGRAYHGLALTLAAQGRGGRETTRTLTRAAADFLARAVEGLRTSGAIDHLPRGLLARAAFCRDYGDWSGAMRDLDEVEEIAEPGPMRLFLCDLALERSRLAFARSEVFVPLNSVEAHPGSAQVRRDASEAAQLTDKARVQIAIARKLVAECDYHKRDAEVAELEAVLKGDRWYADLSLHGPPPPSHAELEAVLKGIAKSLHSPQHDLTVSQDKIADVLVARRDLPEARIFTSDAKHPLESATAFDLDEVYETILSGKAPPVDWRQRITRLVFKGKELSDLTPLAGLTALQELSLDRTSVSDLAPLAGLTALQELSLDRTSVSDLVPLAGLMALQELSLSDTSVSDLAPLAGLTALQQLWLSGTSVSDLAPLAGLTALQKLSLSDTSVSDLAPLAGLTALQKLWLRGTSVSDLAPLAGLAALQELWLSGTSVSDLAPLAGLTTLQELFLDERKVVLSPKERRRMEEDEARRRMDEERQQQEAAEVQRRWKSLLHDPSGRGSVETRSPPRLSSPITQALVAIEEALSEADGPLPEAPYLSRPNSRVYRESWLREAAVERGLADAQIYLGWLYANGVGVEKNEREALKWYRKAAEQGQADAQINLGWLYANGVGVEKNEREALKWYRKAAEQGQADAQINLGWLYANGVGVEKNEREAVNWYRKAAEQGHAAAQDNLGWMYANGVGVEKNEREALEWYRKTKEQGSL
jgi:Leucine-rich repeat (LRR) protein